MLSLSRGVVACVRVCGHERERESRRSRGPSSPSRHTTLADSGGSSSGACLHVYLRAWKHCVTRERNRLRTAVRERITAAHHWLAPLLTAMLLLPRHTHRHTPFRLPLVPSVRAALCAEAQSARHTEQRTQRTEQHQRPAAGHTGYMSKAYNESERQREREIERGASCARARVWRRS